MRFRPDDASPLVPFLRDLGHFLLRWTSPPDRPGVPTILARREFVSMGVDMIEYTVAASPLPPDTRVTTRHLHVTIDGTAGPTLDQPVGSNFLVVAPEGSAVALFSTDGNAAGEGPASPPLTFTATGTDLPPDAPGAPTIVSHRVLPAADPNAPTPA